MVEALRTLRGSSNHDQSYSLFVPGQPRFDFLSEEEEEEARRRQELEDEELAKQLQEEEVRDMSPQEIVNRDRLIAIEAQDEEYARLLYKREKARARRAARERRARKEAQVDVPPGSDKSEYIVKGSCSILGLSQNILVDCYPTFLILFLIGHQGPAQLI